MSRVDGALSRDHVAVVGPTCAAERGKADAALRDLADMADAPKDRVLFIGPDGEHVPLTRKEMCDALANHGMPIDSALRHGALPAGAVAFIYTHDHRVFAMASETLN